MKTFMNYNFNITKIALACLVLKNNGTPVHNNRSYHGLAFHISGQRYYIFDNSKKILAKANDIVYLPKSSNYIVESVEPGDCYAINFELSEDIYFAPFLHKAKNSSMYLELFKDAESCWRKKPGWYEMKCKSNLYAIICLLAKEYESGYVSQSKSNVLLPAIEYIHNEYTRDNISITFLANLCGISETYFRRIFKLSNGVTPLKYINNLKMKFAKELLCSEMYTVSEVAILSGFHDESYFSREFKKCFNVSPSEYAKASR